MKSMFAEMNGLYLVDSTYNRRGSTVVEHPRTSNHNPTVRGGPAMADQDTNVRRVCSTCAGPLPAMARPHQLRCSVECSRSAMYAARKMKRRARGLRSTSHTSELQRRRYLRLGTSLESRACLACGDQFQPRTSDRKYCSRA